MRILLTCATLLASVALSVGAGCGGDDSESAPEGLSDTDTEEIETVLDSAFVNSDPADCAVIYTEKALDQAVTLETDDLVKACEEDLEQAKGEGDADAIDITELGGTPPDATAKLTFDGSGLNGASATIALVEDDGWRIDEVTDVEVESMAAVANGQRESFKSLGFVDKSSSECLRGYVDERGQPRTSSSVRWSREIRVTSMTPRGYALAAARTRSR